MRRPGDTAARRTGRIGEWANRRTGERDCRSPIKNQKSKIENPAAAIAWCELSTGKFLTFEGSLAQCAGRTRPPGPARNPLCRSPRPHAPQRRRPGLAHRPAQETTSVLTGGPAWQLDSHHAAQTLKSHYGLAHFAGLGYDDPAAPALSAAGAIVAYLHDTQKAALEHLQPPRAFLRRLPHRRSGEPAQPGNSPQPPWQLGRGFAGPRPGSHAHPDGFAPLKKLALLSAARPCGDHPPARRDRLSPGPRTIPCRHPPGPGKLLGHRADHRPHLLPAGFAARSRRPGAEPGCGE